MVIEIWRKMSRTIPMMRAAHQSMRAWYSPDLNKHDKLLELLDTYYKVEVNNPDRDIYGDTLSWCLKHCRGKFRDLKHGDNTVWYFEHQEDATMFALKWL
jgi:hypothetical protein